MRKYLFFYAFLMLSCVSNDSPNLIAKNTQYYSEFYIEVGELSPDKIQNGILTVEGHWTEKQKARLKTFWKEEEDATKYKMILQAYLEHEDFLGKDVRPGEPVYNHDDYICSQARIFFVPGFSSDNQPIARGTIEDYKEKKRQYLNFTSVELEPFDNPAAFPLTKGIVLTESLQKQYVLDGNYKIRLQLGSLITEKNKPTDRFYIRLVLRASPKREAGIFFSGAPPVCGPYITKPSEADMPSDMEMTIDMNNTPDMSIDMNANDTKTMDMQTTDISQDLTNADMPIDQNPLDMTTDQQ